MNPFSRIISGTMTWGAWGVKMSTSQIKAQIEKYFALGITTFDHADIYGGYTTEAEFGKAFSQTKLKLFKPYSPSGVTPPSTQPHLMVLVRLPGGECER